MSVMDVLDKLGRMAKLGSILGLALGSLALTVCGGRTGDDQHDGGEPDVATFDASIDAAAPPDGAVDGTVDGSTDPLDAQLWDVICE